MNEFFWNGFEKRAVHWGAALGLGAVGITGGAAVGYERGKKKGVSAGVPYGAKAVLTHLHDRDILRKEHIDSITASPLDLHPHAVRSAADRVIKRDGGLPR
jgi:hypothetical protein